MKCFRGKKGGVTMSETKDSMAIFSAPPSEADAVLVGRGGFGKVYRVFNKLDNHHYAVKKVLITEDSLRNALHEVRILSSVLHPHVIRYFHSWVESASCDVPIADEEDRERLEEETLLLCKNRYYYFHLQMELCPMSLRDYLLRRTGPDGPFQEAVMVQVLEGLDYLHKNGIAHRDIKPDNLLLQSLDPPVVKISDFGLAKVFRNSMRLTEKSLCVGTYLYASPEQFNGDPCSFSTDVYSTGILFYELQVHFKTDMERVCCLTRLKEEGFIETNIAYKNLLTRMIQKDRDLRPTVAALRFLFDRGFYGATIGCRDIVWEIILGVLLSVQ